MTNLQKAVNNNNQLKRFENLLSKIDFNDNQSVVELKCKEINDLKLQNKIISIDPNLIKIENNCRTLIDLESNSFKKLLVSIEKSGVLQNIVIEIKDNPLRIVCIAGQRRLIAAQQLKLEKIPSLLIDGHDSFLKSLDENMHRENLNPIDIADSYAILKSQGVSKSDIAERYEKDEKTVSRYLKIATFPDEAKTLMKKYSDLFKTRVIFFEFAQKKWKNDDDIIREVKLKIENYLNKSKLSRNNNLKGNNNIKEISKKLGLRIDFKENNSKGKLILNFSNEEEKEIILGIIDKIVILFEQK